MIPKTVSRETQVSVCRNFSFGTNEVSSPKDINADILIIIVEDVFRFLSERLKIIWILKVVTYFIKKIKASVPTGIAKLKKGIPADRVNGVVSEEVFGIPILNFNRNVLIKTDEDHRVFFSNLFRTAGTSRKIIRMGVDGSPELDTFVDTKTRNWTAGCLV